MLAILCTNRILIFNFGEPQRIEIAPFVSHISISNDISNLIYNFHVPQKSVRKKESKNGKKNERKKERKEEITD